VTVSNELKNSLQAAAETYHAGLAPAVPYLQGRGVTEETANTFLLGCVTAENVQPGHEQYIARLAIPFQTPTGIIDIRFRSLDTDEGAKYLTRPGASSHLFNVAAFQSDAEVIAICEGEFDTMMAWQCGVNAVGVSGANNWKDWYSRAFNDYRRVFVLCDGDTAGREMGKRIAQQIDVAVVLSMPDGQDVNEFVLQHGAEALRRKVAL
jgi:DNA primase